MKNWIGIILSAGQGKRMRTERPKTLHFLLDRPIIFYLIDIISKILGENYYLIVSQKLYNFLKEKFDNDKLVIQEKPLGTGDAVKKLIPILIDFDGNVLILPGDVPLIREESLIRLCEIHEEKNNACTLLTTIIDNPVGYGRIIRNEKGEIIKIVEDKDANELEKKIKEINTSIYAFSWNKLKEVLPLISDKNVQGEFYLTDAVHFLFERGEKIDSLIVDSWEVLGINNQWELSHITKILRERINNKWMEKGVSFLSPDTIFIGKDVVLNQDIVLSSNIFIYGKCSIGKGVTINNNVYIENFIIGDEVEIGPYTFISKKE
jgi:bifunctional UDP-N-acetylglucosamine pyrophosphorylase/glucosamine-1-phosphate N-acetyltransferase